MEEALYGDIPDYNFSGIPHFLRKCIILFNKSVFFFEFVFFLCSAWNCSDRGIALHGIVGMFQMFSGILTSFVHGILVLFIITFHGI